MEEKNTYKNIPTIGFTNDYYTLWDVSEHSVWRSHPDGQRSYLDRVTHYQYRQNLSMNFEEAQNKMNEKYENYDIDLSLRGNSSFERKTKEYFDNGLDTVVDFGKYQGLSLDEIYKEDRDYLMWLADCCTNDSLKEIINNTDVVKAERVKMKNAQQVAELQAEAQALLNAQSEWVGTEGEREIIEATVYEILYINSENWSGEIIKLRDKNNNIFIKFGDINAGKYRIDTEVDKKEYQEFEEEATYKFDALIKSHGQRDGVKQTIITRFKKIK